MVLCNNRNDEFETRLALGLRDDDLEVTGRSDTGPYIFQDPPNIRNVDAFDVTATASGLYPRRRPSLGSSTITSVSTRVFFSEDEESTAMGSEYTTDKSTSTQESSFVAEKEPSHRHQIAETAVSRSPDLEPKNRISQTSKVGHPARSTVDVIGKTADLQYVEEGEDDSVSLIQTKGAAIPINGTDYKKTDTSAREKFGDKLGQSFAVTRTKISNMVSIMRVKSKQAIQGLKIFAENLGQNIENNHPEHDKEPLDSQKPTEFNESINNYVTSMTRTGNHDQTVVNKGSKLQELLTTIHSQFKIFLDEHPLRKSCIIILAAFGILTIVVAIAVGVSRNQENLPNTVTGKTGDVIQVSPGDGAGDEVDMIYYHEDDVPTTKIPTPAPTGAPVVLTDRMKNLLPLLQKITPEKSLLRSDTPQSQAMVWLSEKDPMGLPLSSSLASKTNGNDFMSFIITQRYTLATLYFATRGDKWHTSNYWLSARDVCEWHGIMCNAEGHVQGLTLELNNLAGTIPEEITSLHSLTLLAIHNNELTGTIPNQIGKLTNMRFLYLDTNSLSGDIPASISSMLSLEELTLSSNKLQGTIPQGLFHCTSLKILWLYQNSLQGALSDRLGTLTRLQELYLDSNQFESTIPSSLGKLNLLMRLNLSNNEFTGRIPPTLGRLRKLISLNLARNQFTSNVPDTLFDLSKLKILHLEQNKLNGSIPTSISQLKDLQILHMHNNSLEGPILEPIMALTSLEELRLGDNSFTGTIPERIGRKLTKLTALHLENNKFGGTIPRELGSIQKLESLNLFLNKFSGFIPSELAKISTLKELYLDMNALSGTIPSELGNLPLGENRAASLNRDSEALHINSP